MYFFVSFEISYGKHHIFHVMFNTKNYNLNNNVLNLTSNLITKHNNDMI